MRQDIQNQNTAQDLRLKTQPRWARPRCGAPTRLRKPCQAQALENGRCPLHGEDSAGRREMARKHMRQMWERRRERERETSQGGGGQT